MANIAALPPALAIPPTGSWSGNDGAWSTFSITVGSPPQGFLVLPATNAPNIWVPIADDCLALNFTDCGTQRGVRPFNNAISPGFQVNSSSSWKNIGTFELGQNDFLGFSGNGAFGYDTIGLIRGDASETITNNDTAVTAYATPQFWLGEIGLSNRPMDLGKDDKPASFLSNLKKAGNIPSLSYGYTAGAPYRSTKIPGSLTLGGYDAGLATEPLQVPLNGDSDRPLTVAIQKISVFNALTGNVDLATSSILIPIDSSITDLWLPKFMCDQFEAAFGLQYNDETNRYILQDKNLTKLQQQNPVLNFTIGTQLSGGNTTTISLPYAAFDLQAGFPIFADTLDYFPIRRAANSSQYMIGRVFLQETYLAVDYERRYFNISQTNYTQSTPETKITTIEPTDWNGNNSTGSNPNKPSTKQGISTGAIAGIAIGTVAGIALLALLLWIFYLKPKRKKRYELDSEAIGLSTSASAQKGEEIMSTEIAELSGGGDRKAEMPGGGVQHPVETEDTQKNVHELPTPIYELPTPFPELPTPTHTPPPPPPPAPRRDE